MYTSHPCLWQRPVPGVFCWYRFERGGRDFQVVCVRARAGLSVSVYVEPVTSFVGAFEVAATFKSAPDFAGVHDMSESLIERFLRGVKAKSAPESIVDPVFRKDYPSVHELMATSILPGGEVRQPCSLLMFSGDGMWKACLNERDLDVSLWASGKGFYAALDCLEERLNAEVVEWRSKPSRGRK